MPLVPVGDPTFSVAVPAFNAAGTVAATLRSVLAQTRADFEVLVIDDGSTDATVDVVEPFLEDRRVRLVRQENRGLAGARNTALGLARGELVSLLDSDDLWLPRYLERMGETLQAHPRAAFAGCDAWLFDDARGQIRTMTARGYQSAPERLPEDPEELLLRLLEGNIVYGGATIRRSALERVGPFNATLRACEDFELWLRVAAHGLGGVRCPECLAVYRQRPGSLSSQELLMARSLRDVYRLVAEEYDVRPEVRARAALALRRLDARIALLEGRRRGVNLTPVRGRLGRLRERLRASRVWYSTTPPELAAALPWLEAELSRAVPPGRGGV